jgi:hypothetical protein
MSEPHPLALRHQREATITRLCEHFARDHIRTEELEALIDRAHRAATPAELETLLAGLPSLDQQPVRSRLVAEQESGKVVAILGAAERKGRWTPGPSVEVVAVMGGAVLDFREAAVPPGGTEIRVTAVMGGLEIIVPPGLAVSNTLLGIVGGFSHAGESRGGPAEGPGALHVSGFAFMGGVSVVERRAGESEVAARQRLVQGG